MTTGRHMWLVITILLIGTLLITACVSAPTPQDSAGDGLEEEEHMEGEIDDNHAHAEVPHEYEDVANPFIDDATAVAAGAEIYAVNCASCHGVTGMGDGPAAAALDPKPASLADSSMMSDMTDAYIYWRITEGGVEEPFNSAMPPWKNVFSEEQRWQLVNYVRTLSQ